MAMYFRRAPSVLTIAEMQQIARVKVPKMFYEYADSGSWTQDTYRRNEIDLQNLKFRQRIAVDMSNRTTKTTMAGEDVAMPLAIAPCGLTGMQWRDGEIAAASAAEEFGVPFTLSTMSICSIEDVAANTTKPFWFQLYVMRDKEFIRRLIGRAKDAGCSALVLTVDLQIIGQRHQDIRNGLGAPPKPTVATALNLMTKIPWGLRMLAAKRWHFGNIVGHVEGVEDVSNLSSWISCQFDPTLSWKDVEEIKEMWGGKVILKGVLDEEDARMAAQVGADAIVVSNHGGRQLDGTSSSISMTQPIVDVVGDDVEVWMDGGIRSGQDVLRAVASGAKGVMAGRAPLYGLGAFGKEGVYRSLEIIQKELDVTMALCGHRDINEVGSDILRMNK